jgi:lysophospholipase L1-like esterase
MRKSLVGLAAIIGVLLIPVAQANAATATAVVPLPDRMAAIGDSISQAYDDCCYYGNHPQDSWSTGWAYPLNAVDSHYAHLLAANPAIRGNYHDDAVAGAKVGDIGTQVQEAIVQRAQYVTILIGANDVCTSSAAAMTPTGTFQSEFQAAMNTLQAGLPAGAHIFVSSIPDIYQLWSVLHRNLIAQVVWYAAGICQSMLSPFNTQADRQQVLAQVVADNGALAQVCDHTPECRWDGDATFDYPFGASQVSHLDYFHPNLRGQAVLAAETWAASWWPTS